MIMTTAAVPIGAALLAATACPIAPLAAYMAAAEAKGRAVMVHPRGKIMMMMRTVVFLIAPGRRCGVGSVTRQPSAGANMTGSGTALKAIRAFKAIRSEVQLPELKSQMPISIGGL